ncbi:GNAT family N-acetyltransferase [Actinacidiphila acidipaludis]|uniref:GNAT family N-acetyltransferase n=1 Tax=Actinacidiphila acidipaludis TaxID=2873382 RepID=A0ABS7Q8D2_9ACTN|nr:GNAT family N-acetyltransferase [Streptomyces acidipaludis]MBY8879403.1 GNAT family N-acetyltransferase [Streptomyces acidipaludis]
MTDPHPTVPVPLRSGERLALALAREEMMQEYHRWETDPATVVGFGARWPVSWDVFRARFHSSHTSDHYQLFEVITADGGVPVGATSLSVDQAVNSAEFTLVIAPEHRGRGYATEATSLTLDWAFTIASLSAVWLEVLAPHTAAVNAYLGAGFRAAGRLRSAALWQGRRVDKLLLDCVPADLDDPFPADRSARPVRPVPPVHPGDPAPAPAPHPQRHPAQKR